MRHLALILLTVATFAGCGGNSGPPLHPVSGKLTIAGQPADDIQITFSPLGEGAMAAGNVIGGQYTMYTGNQGDEGVQAGKYRVLLRDLSDQSYIEDGGQPKVGPDGTPILDQGRIPPDYNSSPKEVEVTSGDNTIDIEI